MHQFTTLKATTPCTSRIYLMSLFFSQFEIYHRAPCYWRTHAAAGEEVNKGTNWMIYGPCASLSNMTFLVAGGRPQSTWGVTAEWWAPSYILQTSFLRIGKEVWQPSATCFHCIQAKFQKLNCTGATEDQVNNRKRSSINNGKLNGFFRTQNAGSSQITNFTCEIAVAGFIWNSFQWLFKSRMPVLFFTPTVIVQEKCFRLIFLPKSSHDTPCLVVLCLLRLPCL